MQKMVILYGLNYALDWAAEVTAPFTPQEFFDELHGLADASGVDYQTLIRLNMCVFKYEYLCRTRLMTSRRYPELTKAMCSFYGAWGAATTQGTGHSYQLRALGKLFIMLPVTFYTNLHCFVDFDTEGPFKKYHQITIYHPSDGKNAFANVGWPGFVGMLSGFNSAKMGLSEIGVYFEDGMCNCSLMWCGNDILCSM